MKAIISSCGTYRYLLTRPSEVMHPDSGTALFLMLNPSTADATADDPTIRRCRGFARAWGCAGIAVANLYALRSTDPHALFSHTDPVGPENDRYLHEIANEYGDAICAWGANARPERVEQVVKIFTDAGARLWCLGTTKSGAPKHPLYIRADQRPIRWPVSPGGE